MISKTPPSSIVRSLAFGTFAILAAGISTTAQAVDFNWTGASGVDSNWLTPGNWTPAGPPTGGGGNFAIFSAATANAAEITANVPDVQDYLFRNNGTVGMRTVNHSAGNANVTGWVRTGNLDGGSVAGPAGIYNLSGGQLSAGSFRIAEGTGTSSGLNVSGGTLRQVDQADPNANNAWNNLGQDGTATMNLSGTGTMSFDNRTHLGNGGPGVGMMTQTGGLFEVRRNELIIADAGTAVYNISAGTLQAATNINVGNWNNSNGQLNVSGTATVTAGGSMTIGQVQNDTFASTGVVTQSAGTVRIGGDINMGVSDNNLGTNHSGTYRLQGGTLDLTGGNFNKETGTAVFEMTGGRLQDLGSFNIGNLNQAGGVLSPGALGAANATTVNGNYTLGTPATLELSILGAAAFDTLVVNGAMTLAGNLSIVDDPAGLPFNTEFIVALNDAADSVAGGFSNAPLTGATFSSANGNMFRINYAGGTGNDVSVTVVPEPATGALLLGSMGMFALLRRRRRS